MYKLKLMYIVALGYFESSEGAIYMYSWSDLSEEINEQAKNLTVWYQMYFLNYKARASFCRYYKINTTLGEDLCFNWSLLFGHFLKNSLCQIIKKTQSISFFQLLIREVRRTWSQCMLGRILTPHAWGKHDDRYKTCMYLLASVSETAHYSCQ